MPGILADKVAVITGGGRGLGLAIAETFALAGARLLIVGRDPKRLDDALHRLRDKGATAHGLTCDVKVENAATLVTEAVLTHFGAWDTLVNSAGVFVWKPARELTEADWHDSLETNLSAPFRLGMALMKYTMSSGGTASVINIGSIHGLVGDGNAVPQCASKFGLLGLTKAMAEGGREHGLRVNAIAPGAIESDSPNRLSLSSGGRVTQADVAQLALYLASDQARAITGATIEAFGLTRPVIAHGEPV